MDEINKLKVDVYDQLSKQGYLQKEINKVAEEIKSLDNKIAELYSKLPKEEVSAPKEPKTTNKK